MFSRNGKIGVQLYLEPDMYFAFEAMRKPNVPRSTFFAQALEEVLNFQKPTETEVKV